MPIKTPTRTAMEEPDDSRKKSVNDTRIIDAVIGNLSLEDSDNNRNDDIDERLLDAAVEKIVNSALFTVGDQWLTVRQVMRILQISDIHTIHRYIHTGKLKAQYVGGKYLILKSDLVAFMNGR